MDWDEKIAAMRAFPGGRVEVDDWYPDGPAERAPYRLAQMEVEGDDLATTIERMTMAIGGNARIWSHYGPLPRWTVTISRPLTESELSPDEVSWHSRRVSE